MPSLKTGTVGPAVCADVMDGIQATSKQQVEISKAFASNENGFCMNLLVGVTVLCFVIRVCFQFAHDASGQF
jgi:hypothetical protein